MTLFRNIIFGLIIILFCSKTLQSQNIKSFSEASDVFMFEFSDFLMKTPDKDDRKTAKEFIEVLKKEWNSGSFSDKNKEQIYKTCNMMLKRKMKPFPDFYAYFTLVLDLRKSSKFDKIFEPWHKSLISLLNSNKSRYFFNYLETCAYLFKFNYLYRSTTTIWKINKTDFEFQFDSIPKIAFNDIILTCLANKDSAYITGTSGYYLPFENKWQGKGGTVNWTRAGFNKDSVYASFSKYQINLKYYKYTADSVTFYHKAYFNKPMIGRLEEKVRADVNEDNASYPRFDSYSKRISIKNIFKNIDYNGGFSLYGAKLLGKGSKQQNARVIFIRKNVPFIITNSLSYTIRKDKIAAELASVTIYYQGDSIYHPGLRMKYISEKKELSFLRYEEGLTQSPYFDTYHKLDMYFEALYWCMDKDSINIEMIKGPGVSSEATFESNNFYTRERFDKIQGIDEINPLSEIKAFYAKTKDKVFYLDEYSKYIKKSSNQTKSLLIAVSNMGFLIYNLDEDKIIIKDKLFNYLDSRAGKTDYDVIRFNSVISGKKINASLDLNNFDLNLQGVRRVSLSDSQKVYIYPKGEELTIKKNRDFTFNGRVHAGLFDFFGSKFFFNYDVFRLDLPLVDSLTFMVRSREKDDKGKYHLIRVKSVIEGISGDLQIDNPKNKSGLKPFPHFPTFTSKNESFVYYDNKNIQKGVYTRDRFLYKINPFSIDSLDDFKADNLALAGTLKSASIFPDIEEPLKVQTDYSLGFIRQTPAEGLPIYGKGTYINTINLSNKGLRGDGSLLYLTSTSSSNDFIFLPDSTNATLQSFEIKSQTGNVEYPYVTAEGVKLHWRPYNDLMTIKSQFKPIAMYDGKTKLTGKLDLSPTILSGGGLMEFNDAELESKLFIYKKQVFDADTADFKLKSYDLKEMAFVTHNYKAHIDFIKQKGEFKSNGGGSKVEFPVNMYICFMDEFDWFMDKDELALTDSRNKNTNLDNLSFKELVDIDLSGSKFISVHPAQDSLQFFSPKAKYNLRHNIISAQGVKIIKVADAAIFPDKGEVTVLKKAEMKTLEKATIIANTTTQFHTVYDANINIQSRKKYEAYGKYDYIDENRQKNVIEFSKISVDSTIQTYGKGYIDPKSKFMLSPAFTFTGNVNLLASHEYLNFDGYTKIIQNCDSAHAYIKFNYDINPNDIYIPITETLTDLNNKPIFTTMFYSPDTTGIYTAFLEPRLTEKDSVIITSKGFLIYDKASKEYRISSKEKLKTLSLPGNYMSFNNANCSIKSEGKFKLGNDFGRVSFNVYGNATNYIIPDSTVFSLAIALDFYFAEKSLDIITNSLLQNTTLKPADVNTEKFNKALAEILGLKEADKLISEISLGMGIKHFPSELKKTFIISDIKFKWMPDIKSYISLGRIGVANMYKDQINKYINGTIVIKKRKTGDELYIYLEPGASEWYFFEYDCRKRLMAGVSSVKEFNTYITDTKADNRKLKSKGDKESYFYYISSERHKNDFLEKYRR